MTLRRWLIALTLVMALPPATALASTNPGQVMRSRMLHLVNASRHAHGVAPLQLNLPLSAMAWRHSVRMVRAATLYHTVQMRKEVRPFHAHAWGEDIGIAGTLLALEHAFMASPVHRANILATRFHHIGVGVVFARGRYWVTLDFYG